jgi:chromosome partitioning protein
MITIAIANQKGGVGKTTLAFNLSQILALKRSTSVLAIDNDPQGNLTSCFLEDTAKLNSDVLDAYDQKVLEPLKVSKKLHFIGSNIRLSTIAERDFQVIFNLKEALEILKKRNNPGKPGKLGFPQYEYIIIDSLPSFGHLHLATLVAADYVLIPVKPAPFALAGLKDLLTTIEKAKRYFNPGLKILGIVINQVDGRRLIMEREMEGILREKYHDLVFKTVIRKRVCVEESPAFQKSITDYNPKSTSAGDFKLLASELLKRIRQNQK